MLTGRTWCRVVAPVFWGVWLGISGAQAADAPGDGATAPREPTAVQIEQRINRSLAVPSEVQVKERPSASASAVARLRQGVTVLVTGLVAGGKWLQIVLPDDVTVGYVTADTMADALGSGPPASAPPTPPAEPASVTGAPVVRDTATLVIGSQNVRLYGLEGTAGPLADGLQRFISADGGEVACALRDAGRYVCTLSDGTDVAMVALVNGAARAEDSAPTEYLRQQEEAQHANRGIWAAAMPETTAPPAPP